MTLKIYTVGHKTNVCQYIRQILNEFKNSFTVALCGKFAIKWLLKITPTLTCNVKTQLRCRGGIFSNDVIAHFPRWKIFENKSIFGEGMEKS